LKAMLRNVVEGTTNYTALMFVCPGCGNDLHMLPINTTEKSPSWDWDGNLEAPTLSPSIKTEWGNETSGIHVCHSFLKAGIFEYLSDCTHQYVNQHIPLPDLPDWIVNE
jgi:Family of unknown function (DUF6527)